jgi:hypothetical protein
MKHLLKFNESKNDISDIKYMLMVMEDDGYKTTIYKRNDILNVEIHNGSNKYIEVREIIDNLEQVNDYLILLGYKPYSEQKTFLVNNVVFKMVSDIGRVKTMESSFRRFMFNCRKGFEKISFVQLRFKKVK